MLKADTLNTGREARKKLMSGIQKAATAVGSTMGTGGSNSLVEAMQMPGYLNTNDGATILESIRFSDPIEEMGRKIVVESVSRANKVSGDGSSTTCVETAAILTEGTKVQNRIFGRSISPMELKRSLEECIPLIVEGIEAQKKEITVDEVGAVASISAEDEEIGYRIQEIYQKIGKDGIIHWDISKNAEDSYTIGTGITVNGAGMASPYMADMDEKSGRFLNQARWKNPKILILKQKITSAADFNDLFQALFNKEIKEVVMFCDEYEASIIPDLIQTRAVRGFKSLLVKMPILWKDEWYEDLAKATGATVIDPNAGISLKTMKMEHLGTVEHITVTKEDTFIDGIQDLSLHVKQLEEEGTDSSLQRASRLNTKTARYFVGAHSESALSYRRLKVEDAISAAWQALQGGIVVGGGFAISNVRLPNTIGGKILRKALKAPTKQIEKNLGHKLSQAKLIEQNVFDPANVVINAAKNAISVAASVLTTNTLVLLPRETQENMPIMPTL